MNSIRWESQIVSVVGQDNLAGCAGTDDGSVLGSAPKSGLSPWPTRIVVYLILVAIALLAICVIDSHAMLKQVPRPAHPVPSGGP